jgi:hypothetical protein
MSEVEQAEVEHVLDFKVEYIFKFDKEKSYKFCVARLDDPIFKNVHGGQLCDVYQVHDIPYEDPTPELTKLRKFVDDRGGKIYAERYDMNAYLSHSEHNHPYDIVTIWTSKIAFDKWHFINDHLIDKPSMLNPRHGGSTGTLDALILISTFFTESIPHHFYQVRSNRTYFLFSNLSSQLMTMSCPESGQLSHTGKTTQFVKQNTL